MSDLTVRMELIRSQLSTSFPARIVTRDLMDYAQRKDEDMLAGVYTLVSDGEGEYPNYNGREAMDGRQRLLLVGQFRMAENSLPSAIEDAELAMVDEVKGFLRARPSTLAQLFMTGFRQSRQLDAPYGWVVMDLEYLQ